MSHRYKNLSKKDLETDTTNLLWCTLVEANPTFATINDQLINIYTYIYINIYSYLIWVHHVSNIVKSTQMMPMNIGTNEIPVFPLYRFFRVGLFIYIFLYNLSHVRTHSSILHYCILPFFCLLVSIMHNVNIDMLYYPKI
jgi:hypothetical protein